MNDNMDLEAIKKWMHENLLTKHEARKITGQSSIAFNQSVTTEKLRPFYQKGDNMQTMVRLFLRSEVEKYAPKVKERRKRLKKD